MIMFEKMTIEGIMHDALNQHVLLLKNSKRWLPIWIDPYQAMSIMDGLTQRKMPRPMTHDLLKNIINGFDSVIDRVTIYKIENSTFFASIKIKRKDVETGSTKILEIDCRPSDAIAIAVRFQCDIYASQDVLAIAGKDDINIENKEV